MTPTPTHRIALCLLALWTLAPSVAAREGAVPASHGAPAIAQVLRVSIATDRSAATVATLAAPVAGEAVFWQRGDASTLVVRTGEPVAVDGGARFELRAIGRAWAAPGALLYLGTTVQGPPVLVRHDAAGARLLAVGADPAGALLAHGARPVISATGCGVELEVFDLLGAGATPLSEDGSVRFSARLGAPCDDARAQVRYRDGRYAIESLTVAPLVADGSGIATDDGRTLAPPVAGGGADAPWRDAGAGTVDVAAGEVPGVVRP